MTTMAGPYAKMNKNIIVETSEPSKWKLVLECSVNELVRIAMPVRKMLKKNNGGMFEYLLRNHKPDWTHKW